MVAVQAKDSTDVMINSYQVQQDIWACQQAFPTLYPRPVGVIAFEDRLVFMEFAEIDGQIRLIREKHYWLV